MRWVVPPLELPEDDAPLAALVGADAVRLLVERATAADPGFSLDADSAAGVVRLCRRVDGLPLAIELAAARVGALSVARIAERLPHLDGHLRGADRRQRTLRATIDWSHDLLAPAERLLFARLATFAGGWTMAEAEAVGGGEGLEASEVLDVLLSLVDRSLVTAEGREPPRQRMLETIGAYAAERLAGSGEQERVRRRHAAWFRDLALSRPGNAVLEAEQDNLRSAADWALANGDRETALEMNAALVWFWATGHLMEGRQRLAGVLAPPLPPPSRALARALLAQAQLDSEAFSMRAAAGTARASLEMFAELGDDAGVAEAQVLLALHAVQGQQPVQEARRLLEAAEAVARALGDERVEGWALAGRMLLELLRLGRLDAAIASGDALARFRAVNEEWGVAFTLSHLAFASRQRGDLEEAGRLYGDALAYARQTQQWWMTSMALTELGTLALIAGDAPRADALHAEALALVERMNGPRGIAFTLNAMGVNARVRGDHERSLRLHERALELHTQLTHPRLAWSLALLGHAEAALGHSERARDLLAQALVAAHERTQPHTVALALEGLAGIAADEGDAERAGTLLGAASAVRERVQTPPDPIEQADRDRAADAAGSSPAFALAVERGRAAPLDRVLEAERP